MSFAIHLATPAPFYMVHNDKSSPLRLPDTVVCRSKRRRPGCAVLDKSSATTAGRVNMTLNSGCTGWLQPLPDLWPGLELRCTGRWRALMWVIHALNTVLWLLGPCVSGLPSGNTRVGLVEAAVTTASPAYLCTR